MSAINEDIIIHYFAKNLSTGRGQTGDDGNHTLRLSKGGVLAAFTATPSIEEVNSTYARGLYAVTVPGADNDTLSMALCGISSTSNVEIVPTAWLNDSASLSDIYDSLQNPITNSGAYWRDGVISIVRGDDYDGLSQPKLSRDFTDADNDLTEWTAKMTWRKYGRPDAETPVYTETVTPTHVSGTTYRVQFAPLNAQTSVMAPVKNGYYYDVLFLHPDGKRSTREIGNIIVARNASI